MARRKATAFTVVELLVVVAILAVLLSLVTPSLQRAKELARRAVCTSNLKQIGTGLGSYASEQREWLPPAHISDAPCLEQSWKTYLAYTNDKADADGMTPWNLAMTYEAGHVDDHRAFYCPSQRTPLHSISSFTIPWGGSVDGDPKDIYVRTAYNYSPYPDEAGNRHRYKRLAVMPSDKVLVMDLLAFDIKWNRGAVCHGRPKPGWDMAFPDGSVDFRRSQNAYDFIWSHSWGPGDVGHDWGEFQVCLDMLTD